MLRRGWGRRDPGARAAAGADQPGRLLDDVDRELIGKRRGDHNRLGFALQMCTVRYLGLFLEDPLDVPWRVIEYLAEHLGVEDASCVKRYTERLKTAYEHAREIRDAYGYHPFEGSGVGPEVPYLPARAGLDGRRGAGGAVQPGGGVAASEPLQGPDRPAVLARGDARRRHRRLRAAGGPRPEPGEPEQGDHALAGHAAGGRLPGDGAGRACDLLRMFGREDAPPRSAPRSPSTGGSPKSCTCCAWSTRWRVRLFLREDPSGCEGVSGLVRALMDGWCVRRRAKGS
nr:DUF4158 domain-containing protein [Streptomyces sp. TRM68367]